MARSPVTMPQLSMPLDSRQNPHVETAKSGTWNWARTFDLIKSASAHREFESAKIWELAAFAYPAATAPDLCLISDWLTYMHIQSSQFAEARAGRTSRKLELYVASVLALMREPRLATVRDDGALAAAFSELWARLRQRLDAGFAARFVAATESYLTGYLWAVENRTYSYIPSESEYLTTRRDTSGFRLLMLLSEMSLREDVPPAIREHPPVVMLTELANDAMSWIHDLYRMERFARRNDAHHLVAVVKQQYGVSAQEAVNRVGKSINTALEAFSTCRTSLAALGLPQQALVERYVDGIERTLKGMIDWLQSNTWFSSGERI